MDATAEGTVASEELRSKEKILGNSLNYNLLVDTGSFFPYFGEVASEPSL
jgi:hypothetical protein